MFQKNITASSFSASVRTISAQKWKINFFKRTFDPANWEILVLMQTLTGNWKVWEGKSIISILQFLEVSFLSPSVCVTLGDSGTITGPTSAKGEWARHGKWPYLYFMVALPTGLLNPGVCWRKLTLAFESQPKFSRILSASWQYIESLKLAMIAALKPQTLANTTNQASP